MTWEVSWLFIQLVLTSVLTEGFFERMNNYVNDDNSLIFTEDLKNALYLVEDDENELLIVEKMLNK